MRSFRTVMRNERKGLAPAASALVSILILGACARNPVTGERELMLVSEAQEIQMGQQAAQQIPQELGLLEDGEITRRVQDLGLQMARASERPHLPWEFHVVDSPVVNAFAIPGGFIYLTRGILAHMNTEAEMVGVLGHEIGHVTARHSAQQISQSQLAGLGLGLSMVFVPEVRPFGDILQSGLGLMFLKFGRDDETEADRLGVRYAVNIGYDPRPMAEFFQVLDRLGGESGEVIPNWLSTHPDPADREQKILELAREAAPDAANLKVNEEAFKRRLDGVVFGDDPREGFMDGNVFKHPELRFRIAFPSGWQVQNTRQSVFAGSNDGGFQMTASRVEGNVSPSAHASRLFQRAGLQAGAGRSLSLEGFQAFVVPFRQANQSGVLDGEAAFIRDGRTMYELFAYTSPDRYRRMRNIFLEIFGSFSRLTDPRDLNVQAQRIVISRVPRAMSARRALVEAGVVPEQLEAIALVNH
ncbi:MAG: M48 family metalloprotease, partial [Vicinamibacteria bacterium]